MNWQTDICNIPQTVLEDVVNKSGVGIKTAHRIGTGCYADVYRITFENETVCVLKWFRFPQIAEQELCSYDILAQNNAFPMPKLLFCNATLRYICMEYLKGKTLSCVCAPNDALAAEAVEMLIHCHGYHCPVTPKQAASYWENAYQARQNDILQRSRLLVSEGQLNAEVYETFRASVSALQQILGDSVQQLSLIHGDFTPWNIIVDDDEKHITAVFDPYLASYGDREYDLMMMNKANGIPLNLVALYRQRIPLSAQFERKMVYYNAWNELCHYFYSDRKQSMHIDERAYELGQVI